MIEENLNNTYLSIKFDAEIKPQQHHVVNEMDELENRLLPCEVFILSVMISQVCAVLLLL
jgi:hypothetical protein